jgi:signal transduction histidine kinase/streptogramin lyase
MQYLLPHANHFIQQRDDFGYFTIERTTEGIYWSGGDNSLRRMTLHPDQRFAIEDTGIRHSSQRPALDKKGDLWFVTDADGIFRVPSRLLSESSRPSLADVDHYRASDGLSADDVIADFVDREGGIWFITSKGIDYFRRTPFNVLPMPKSMSGIGIAGLRDGDVLFSNYQPRSVPLIKLHDGILTPVPDSIGGVGCLYAESKDSLWIGYEGKIIHRTPTETTTIIPPRHEDPAIPDDIQAIMVDKTGGLWVSRSRESPFLYKDGTWTQPTAFVGHPMPAPLSMLAARDGSLWFGFPNRLVVLSQGIAYTFDEHSGLRTGSVAAFSEHGDHIWLAGSGGVQLVRHGSLYDLLLKEDGTLGGVSGVIETASGDLWLDESEGAVHITHEDVVRFLDHPDSHVAFTKYDTLDNFPGAPTSIRPLPSLVQSADGRLYFAGRGAVAWLDPAAPPLVVPPPGIRIDSVTVDDEFVSAEGVSTVRTRPRNIRFDFAAGTLLVPEKATVRYMLQGFDKEWISADSRRQVIYSNLPPGHFTFKAISVNSIGIASPTAAEVTLIVPPTFLQSDWFKLLCVVLAAGAVWLVFLLRGRHVTDQMTRRFAEQQSERDRIARDLHDSFFPAVQGLLLRFHTGTRKIESPPGLKNDLESTLDSADEVMDEGRKMISELRDTAPHQASLEKQLSRLGEELESSHGTPFSLRTVGEPRPLAKVALREASTIAKEAIRNAYSHARASHIEAQVRYSKQALEVVISDDGVGMPLSLTHVGKENHWGIPGMRERAKLIRSEIAIDSAEGRGTRITLRVPKRIAFEKP